MRKIVVVLGLFAFAGNAQADVSGMWAKRLPSAGIIRALARRADDRYSVTFRTADSECVGTIDQRGNTSDAQCFGGLRESKVASSDGAYFLFGVREDGGAPWAGKFDKNGQRVWSKAFEAPQPLSVSTGIATSDGGILLGGGYGQRNEGTSYYDASALVKLAPNGSPEWTTVLDFSAYEMLRSACETADGYVLAGTAEFGVFVAKLNRHGAVVWIRWLADAGGYANCAVLGDGDLVIGTSKSVVTVGRGTSAGYVIARFSAAGDLRWQKQMLETRRAYVRFVVARDDGSFVIGGAEFENGNNIERLIAVSSDGNALWQRLITLPGKDFVNAVAPADDGSFLVAAYVDDFAEIWKVSATGDVPAALVPITTAADTTFSSFRSVSIAPPLTTSTIPIQASDDPIALRTEPVLAENVGQKQRRSAAAAVIEPVKPDQEAAIFAAQRTRDDMDALTQRVVDLLSRRSFMELEQMGREFRDTRAEFDNSYRKLFLFYTAISTPSVAYGAETQHLQTVEEWLKAFPSSATAAVAAASTYIRYAADARGQGYASSITAAASRKFHTLLSRADQILRGSGSFASADPQYQQARIEVAGTSCNGVAEILRDPQLAKVGDFAAWRTGANYMTPWWCGDPEAYRRLAEMAGAATKAMYGDGLYALIAWDAIQKEQAREAGRDAIAKYGFEWTRIKQGLLDLIRRYPNAPANYHRLAQLAAHFDDRAAAKAIFDKPLAAWSLFAAEIWPSRYEYDRVRTWAMTQVPSFVAPAPGSRPAASTRSVARTPAKPQPTPASALRKPAPGSDPAGAASWPPLVLRNDVRLQDGSSYRLNSFLVETSGGVVAVSALTLFGTLVERARPGGLPPATFIEPVQIDRFRSRLVSWTMFAPARPGQKFTVAAIEPKVQKFGQGVVLTLAPAKGTLPVQVLKRHDPLVPGRALAVGRLFVVLCRDDHTGCAQSAVAGSTTGAGGNAEYMQLTLLLDSAARWQDVVGSPVIDDNGLAVGVVTGLSTDWDGSDPAGSVRLTVEEINAVLRKAGL